MKINFFQRAKAAIRYTLTGDTGWFGPMSPLPAQAPSSEKGRQLDYPVGYNVNIPPRSYEPLSFLDLRNFAETCDILRLVMETRKDQISVLDWSIKPRDLERKPDARCARLQDFLQSPDLEHTWADWIRMLLEDLFVIDAPSIYVRPTKGGEPYSFEVIDGATISRKLDHFGRTPQPPATAYQQILHGINAIDLTSDELIYRPRNLRPHKIYGYSPTEQIVGTLNTAIRRAKWQFDYFEEGNVPAAIMSAPKEWGVDQIKEFQQYLDLLLTGNAAQRRKMIMIPEGITYRHTIDPQHFDTFDEWLARIICYCYSISPTPFIRQMNRATAQTVTEQSLKEGLEPIKRWIKYLHDDILRRLKAQDLEFCWEEEEDIDPLVQAQIYDLYIKNGTLSTEAVRRRTGADPSEAPQESVEEPMPTKQTSDEFEDVE